MYIWLADVVLFKMLINLFASWLGKKAVEDRRQQLIVAKKHAESVAVITTELEQAFLEVYLLTELMVLL